MPSETDLCLARTEMIKLSSRRGVRVEFFFNNGFAKKCQASVCKWRAASHSGVWGEFPGDSIFPGSELRNRSTVPEASQRLERRDSCSPALLSQERGHENMPRLLGEEAGSCSLPALTPPGMGSPTGGSFSRAEAAGCRLSGTWFMDSPSARAPGAGRQQETDAGGNHPSPVWVCQAWSIWTGRVVSGTAWQQSQQRCCVWSHPILCMCLKSE